MNTPTPIIESTNLDKFYGTFHALKDINLTVHQGEKMVICGPSGSGKSTLIRCFNGLEWHNSGRLVIDGIEVHENAKEIRELRQEERRVPSPGTGLRGLEGDDLMIHPQALGRGDRKSGLIKVPLIKADAEGE